jgi:hypothetical protein
MNSCMRSLSEDAPIKQTWLGTANVRREFPVSSAHASVQSVRKNIREDMEDRWVTNLSEDRKKFYLVSSLLDPRTKMLSFCDNKYFPSVLERRCPRLSFNDLRGRLLDTTMIDLMWAKQAP